MKRSQVVKPKGFVHYDCYRQKVHFIVLMLCLLRDHHLRLECGQPWLRSDIIVLNTQLGTVFIRTCLYHDLQATRVCYCVYSEN